MLYAHLAALALAAIALAVSGCGGSSKTGSTTTAAATKRTTTAAPPTIAAATVKVATGKPLTRATLISKGDAICARRNAKLMAISVAKQGGFARVFPEVAIYDSTESSELSKLVPPASLAHDWARIINIAHLYSEYINRIASDIQTGSYASARTLIDTSEGMHRRLMVATKRDGFRHCSEVG